MSTFCRSIDARHGIATLALLSLVAVVAATGCSKLRGGSGASASASVAAPPPPPKPAVVVDPGAAVEFQGTFTRYAKATYDKAGNRRSSINAKGLGTLTIEPGKVTFAQTYNESSGTEVHVTQVYSFTGADVRPVTGKASGFDVALKFVKMDSDTPNYSADDRNPRIQARKLAQGWQIGLLLMDGNGVNGGQEFR